MIFFIYSVKIIFLFPTNMILPSCQKSKDDLPKNTLKDDIFGEKIIFILENMVFFLTGKDNKKVYLVNRGLGRTSVVNVNKTLNKF